MALILVCEIQGDNPQAVFYGLLSGVFYAGVVLSLRQMREFESSWLVALNHVGAAIVFVPYVASRPAYWPHGTQWLLLAGFGILQMGLPYVCFARAQVRAEP